MQVVALFETAPRCLGRASLVMMGIGVPIQTGRPYGLGQVWNPGRGFNVLRGRGKTRLHLPAAPNRRGRAADFPDKQPVEDIEEYRMCMGCV